MKSWILAIVALLCVASPALAVDPPPFVIHSTYSLALFERDILVEEVDGEFYGKLNFFGQGVRTYRFVMAYGSINKIAALEAVLKDNVGEIIRVEGFDLQSIVRTGTGTPEYSILLTNAKVIEE